MIEALPTGTRLLHVGPHKTGTTALQSAFHRSRKALEVNGVHYAGSAQQPMAAALAASNMTTRRNGGAPLAPWEDLLAEVEASTADYVVISSEFFANAGPKVAKLIAAELDLSRVHVVITLRPLAKILPSQWQQYVQNGLTVSYDDWLDAMFNQPPFRRPTPTFWRRHRHDRLVRRWVRAVGAANVTVVVVDDSDRTAILRTFEALVGAPVGTLVPADDRTNRSMTIAEARVVRAFNELFAEAGLPDELYQRAMRFGAARVLTREVVQPDDRQIRTPAWALDRVDDLAHTMIRSISVSGAHVIGDLDQLAATTSPRTDPEEMDTAPISALLAARTALGVATALGAANTRADSLTNRQLAGEVARRSRERARRAADRLRRR